MGKEPIPKDIICKFSPASLEIWVGDVAAHSTLNDIDEFKANYLEESKKYPLKTFDAIIETIREIKNRGYKTCVVSNAGIARFNEKVAPILEGVEFDFVRCRDYSPGELCKPNSEYLDKVLEHFHCKPSDIIYIGDLYEDYEFAKATGMNFIWSAYGQDNGKMAKLSGLHKIENPTELLSIIKSIDDLERGVAR
jgi:HAD superfamily hydrolase (TIGR01662 family)